MHEFSICESLVDAVLAEMRRIEPPPRRLVKSRVVVGGLRQIVPDYLREAYGILTKETPAEGSDLEIRSVPILGKCRACGWQGELQEAVFECPKCGSLDVEMVGGTELYLESMEVEQEETGAT
ncbi:MAG: hydrogenase maturation nickel metallochaperone HypA [Kiritimatiellae bacterium]|nr:hydrogenase maturation nickel metallochaperone HypA [Kiritimatiellia bacterium]